ncbi:MAG: polysaccharide biosynthesis C-terminal domain-containing protein [Bacteroides sp.]|nr:polysaccharide biosynthesis C-terminal domain-containing protein [Bacteroides sp.]
MNYLFIPEYGQYSAAIGASIAEFLVMFVMILLGRKYIPIHFFSYQNKQYIIGTIMIVVFLTILSLLPMSDIYYLLIGIPVSIVVYLLYLLFCEILLFLN